MSIVQAHIDNHNYANDDKIICYFALPRIGVAVALRPVDCLLFNPCEPHSISSCCNREDDIFIISSYLKTAVVGLHDNSDPIVQCQQRIVCFLLDSTHSVVLSMNLVVLFTFLVLFTGFFTLMSTFYYSTNDYEFSSTIYFSTAFYSVL